MEFYFSSLDPDAFLANSILVDFIAFLTEEAEKIRSSCLQRVKVRKTTRRGGLNCVFGNFFFYVLGNCSQVQSLK